MDRAAAAGLPVPGPGYHDAATGRFLAGLHVRDVAGLGRAPTFSWTLLVVLPVAACGLYLAIGRFFVARKQRACTFYAVTNERVLIVSGVFRRHLQSVNLAQLTDVSMTQRADGSGSITFGDRFPYPALFGGIAVPTMELYVATQFFRIPDVARVCALIHDAQQQAWSGRVDAAG